MREKINSFFKEALMSYIKKNKNKSIPEESSYYSSHDGTKFKSKSERDRYDFYMVTKYTAVGDKKTVPKKKTKKQQLQETMKTIEQELGL